MNRDLASMRSPEEESYDIYSNHPEFIKFRMDFIKRRPGWWRELEVIPAGLHVLDIINSFGFESHILTKGPSSKSAAWAEKVEWVRDRLPTMPITITEDKSLVYGRILYDDYPPYVERWLDWRPRGLVIMNENEGNRRFSHPNVIKVNTITFSTDVEAVKELAEKVKEAYER